MTRRFSAVWMRWVGIFLLVILLVWMPFEATSQHGAILIAAAGIVYGAWFLAARRQQNKVWYCWHYIALGLVSGLAVAPLTLALMALKNGFHAHATPEYSAGQILAVVSQAPVFLLSGLLVGTGLDLYCRAQRLTIRR